LIANLLWIGAGGALGALLRYASVVGVQHLLGSAHRWPWGTLVVNVVGSFAAGALVGWLSSIASPPSMARPFLMVGVLGGFTTFSAFSVESLGMLQAGRFSAVLVYALASVVGCVVAALIGFKCST
jgi:fluoride exporter